MGGNMDTTLQPRIETRIQIIRGLKVILDADLAELYGVSTKALNQAVKRNIARFPPDFRFQLDADEKAEVVTNCDHLEKLKFSSVLPHAFTEHGAIQAANVLASAQAIDMGIYVVRAFVRMRALSSTHDALARRLAALEHQAETLALHHDNLAHDVQVQLRQVFDALRALMAPPPAPAKRPIGFVPPGDTSRKPPT